MIVYLLIPPQKTLCISLFVFIGVEPRSEPLEMGVLDGWHSDYVILLECVA